jgi:hypothetical protein
MNTITFADMTSAELAFFFNENCGDQKQVKRFADRATAIKRCEALVAPVWGKGEQEFAAELATKQAEFEIMRAKEEVADDREIAEWNAGAATPEAPEWDMVWGSEVHGHQNCPSCGIHLSNGVSVHGDDVNGKPLRHDTHEFECLGCGAGFGKELRKVANSTTRSAAIAKSWLNVSVAAARAQRTQVRVVDEAAGEIGYYKSLAKAWYAYGLPMSKHIAFRMALKAAGAKDFGPYKFSVVAA